MSVSSRKGDYRIAGTGWLAVAALACVGFWTAWSQEGVSTARMNVAETTSAPAPPNRAAPDVTPPPSGLRFSDWPTDAEFLRVGLFEMPLVPTGTSTPQENRDLANALVVYDAGVSESGRRDAVAPLLHFLSEYRQSPWAAVLEVNLGAVYRQTGHFSQVAAIWQSAWKRTKDRSDPNGRAIADAAVAALSQFEAYLGRKEELGPLLADLKGRPMGGTAAELVSESSRGLAEMRERPEVSFKCGPFALQRIALDRDRDPSARSLAAFREARSTSQGLSLSAVQELSARTGMNYHMAFRAPGAPVVVPAVAHWKVGHFAAILAEEQGRYRIGDATFGEDIRMSAPTLDEEASGYFLVSPGALPPGWRTVGEREGRRVWGRGNTGSNKDNGATGPGDGFAFDVNPNQCPGGCTTWNVEPMVVGLALHDAPVGYRPPIGPSMMFDVYYSQRDVQQPQMFNYVNLGPKWTTSWLSYVTDNTLVNATAMLYRRGGGNETYAFTAGSPTSQTGPFSQAIVTRTTDATGLTTGFSRQLNDGSVEEFGQALGTKYFLTAVADSAGNKAKIAYDAQMRIASLTDAIGQVTTLSYEAPSDPLKITKVTDPFGRSATFAYDASGNLSSITDTIGITSSFTLGAGGFVTSLQTPYGTSKFAFGDSTIDPTLGSVRWLEATDALGRISRVEFRHQAPGIPTFDGLLPPKGMLATNDLLQWRNSFMWNAAQYAAAKGPAGLDYTKARLTHWLHTADNSTSRVIESTKEPLENRVWYDYPGQTNSVYVGTSNTPLHVGRVLDDKTTQLWSYQYGPSGTVTKVTDPMGRQVSYEYAANGIDILAISNTTGGANDRLATFTYGTQHVPLTLAGANGATTRYDYNPAGQPIKVTDALGNATAYAYDANGYLSGTDGPTSGAHYSLTHDAVGHIASATDSAGALVMFEYDAADRRTRATFPNGSSTQYAYHLLDLATVTDRLGHAVQYTYDAERQPTQVTDALGQSVKLAYTLDGQIASITDPNGHVTSVARDLEGRPVTKQTADGHSHTIAYEKSSSRLRSVTDAAHQTSEYAYNADDALAGVTYANAAIPTPAVRYRYDPVFPRPVGMTDGLGDTQYAYYPDSSGAPGAGLLRSVTSPIPGAAGMSDTVTYTYDALDRVVGRTVNGDVESTTYDALGRETAVTNALDAFVYGYAGATERVATVGSMRGPKLAFDYYDPKGDGLLRQITATSSGGSPLAQFGYAYDARGAVSSFSKSYLGQAVAGAPGAAPTGMMTPPMGRGFGKTGGGSAGSGREFGPHGSNRRDDAQESAHGDRTLFLATLGLLALAAAMARSALAGRRLAPVLLLLLVWSCGSDARRTSGSPADAGAPPPQDAGNGGMAVGPAKPSGDLTTYSYDLANRLVSAVVSEGAPSAAPSQFGYTYDAASNLMSISAKGHTQPFTYDTVNALSPGTYDANGNPTNVEGVQYRWDAEDRLVALVAGDHETHFAYDGLDRLVRIGERVGGNVVADHAYLWCGGVRCLERDNRQQGSPVTKRYFDQGVVVGSDAYYYVSDNAGSVRELVDATGKVRAQYDYDPYGNSVKIGGDLDSDIGYAGYFHHAPSGLAFSLRRAYDPAHGRWLNRDPIGLSGGESNLYSYVGGDPVNYVDPSGLDKFAIVERIAGAGVKIVRLISRGEALQALKDAFKGGVKGGAHVAADSEKAATDLAKDYATECGSGTVAGPEQHVVNKNTGELGAPHVHGEQVPDKKRLPGHIFFDPKLFDKVLDILDILIPGPVFIGNFPPSGPEA